ncbi:MAG: hypothetical protein E6J79_11980 [Deltaproteobacteria bacterium]|nr:MAG: hypothetical protein E6J79_11980 [Deltaproteobacteria bacterium]
MDHDFPSPEHPDDGELLEGLLRREPDAHLARCPLCAKRADAIARDLDPLGAGSAREPFDAAFYRRQAAAIEARLAAREGTLGVAPLPRVAWGAAAVAAVLAVAVGLRAPRLVGGPVSERARPVAEFTNRVQRAQDRADDRFLREIDDLLDEDPYDVDLGDG